MHCRLVGLGLFAPLLFVFALAASSAQAHSSEAKTATSPSNTRTARVKAQTAYKGRLEKTVADHTVADNRTRALARHSHADQIASLQFIDLLYGPTTPILMPTTDAPNQVIMRTDFEPIVTDRRLISEFLQALRHVYKLTGATPTDATPSRRMTFKPIGKLPRTPLDIDINFAYFGPEFQSVLNKVPGYLAAQLHHKMQTLDGQVREVNFAILKVTDPRKIAQITKALTLVKPDAFSVYGNTRDTFGLSLRLRQGGSEDVVFVIDPSLKSRGGSSILPDPLWNYYKLVSHFKITEYKAKFLLKKEKDEKNVDYRFTGNLSNHRIWGTTPATMVASRNNQRPSSNYCSFAVLGILSRRS